MAVRSLQVYCMMYMAAGFLYDCCLSMAGGYGGMTLGVGFDLYWVAWAMEKWDFGAGGDDDDGETKTNKP